jgi:lysophospholipase L1-like esterase
VEGNSTRILNIVQMGDSYSSGVGARDTNGNPSYEDEDCMRSDYGWGGLYAQRVQKLYGGDLSVNYINLACTGAKIPDNTSMVDGVEQLPLLESDFDIVLLTIGGNDANFIGLVAYCFVPSIQDVSKCQNAVEKSRSVLTDQNFSKLINNFLFEIWNRTSRDTKVVFLQYPYLALNNPEWNLTSANGFSIDADFEIREIGDLGDDVQRQATQDANREAGKEFVVYVDSIKDLFAGHEVDPRIPDRTNNETWINGATTTSTIPDIYEQFHINQLGHDGVADHLLNKYGTFGVVPEQGAPGLIPEEELSSSDYLPSHKHCLALCFWLLLSCLHVLQ